MATDPPLVYVKRPKCEDHGRPDLAPTSEMVTEAGQTWTCPVDGRTWTTVIQYGTGAQCNTIWQATAPPGKLSPLGQRVAAVESRTATLYGARAVTAAIAVNNPIVVQVTWLPGPAPDLNYELTVLPSPALLGKVTWSEVPGARTQAGTKIQLTALAAVLVASDVLVIATRYGGPV